MSVKKLKPGAYKSILYFKGIRKHIGVFRTAKQATLAERQERLRLESEEHVKKCMQLIETEKKWTWRSPSLFKW